LLLCLVLAAFTADVLDLRDEILIPASPYGNLDETISSGLQSTSTFLTPEMPRYVHLSSQPEVPSWEQHALPFDLRAPPLQS